KCAGQEIEQRRLARPIRPDKADPVAALDADGEVFDDGAGADAPGEPFGLDDQLAGGAALAGDEHRGASRAGGARLPALPPQLGELAQAALVAASASGDPVAQPVLFAGDPARKLLKRRLFRREDAVAPGLEGGKSALEPARRA